MAVPYCPHGARQAPDTQEDQPAAPENKHCIYVSKYILETASPAVKYIMYILCTYCVVFVYIMHAILLIWIMRTAIALLLVALLN